MADVIGVLRAGRLLQWGAALDLYHEPNCPAVADFVGNDPLFDKFFVKL